jgi:hypothetical protein
VLNSTELKTLFNFSVGSSYRAALIGRYGQDQTQDQGGRRGKAPDKCCPIKPKKPEID